MVRRFMKKQSKRITCRKKYKIIRKVNEHNRKLRRDKKKHPEKYRSAKSDPGVPNTLPFKDKILEEAAEYRKLQEEAKERRRNEAKERRKLQREGIIDKKRNIGAGVNEMLKSVEKRTEEFNQRQKDEAKNGGKLSDNSAKSFYREFKKVVENANVILEVLDARDPLGTRCPQMESAVMSQSGKRLVLILNKADLVPRANLEKWLSFLRREHPTVVFKSCTQTQNNNLARSTASALNSDALNSSRCIGADVLLQLLKNYCRNQGSMTSIDVGVVGLPNVGKSSLINSLKRSKSCGVGATPGFTKNMQTIQIDSKIRLLDSPGIVLPGGDLDDGIAALRNTVKIGALDDPTKPVQAIYNKCKKSQLTLHYRMPEFKDYEEFLVLLAKRLGKLKKGGIPDTVAAARSVLYDWTVGKIKYYTEPPVIEASEISASIVSTLAEEFSLDSLKETEDMELSQLPMIRPSDTMCVDTMGPVTEIREVDEEEEEDMDESSEDEEEDDEEEMQDDETLSKNIHIDMGEDQPKAEVAGDSSKAIGRTLPTFDASKMTLKKYQKKLGKKNRKEKNRNVRRADSLVNAFQSMGGIEGGDDSYNFKDYYDLK